MTVLIVDISNAMHRTFWSAQRASEGTLASNILLEFFSTLNKAIRVNNVSSMIAVFDYGSWRREIFPGYKIDRRTKVSNKTITELRDMEVLYKVIESTTKWFINNSNVLSLRAFNIEADDWVSFFIRANPQLNHVIFSSDADFHQLLAPNVTLYDAIKDTITKPSGIYKTNGTRARGKDGEELPIPDVEWELFLKCMRGDTSDSIPSAAPGLRIASSKKKIGLKEAFDDRHNKSYAWNSVMLSEYNHPDGTMKIIDAYERNSQLIDLSRQPQEVIKIMATEYLNRINVPKRDKIGLEFLKFIGEYRIPELKYKSQDTLVKLFNQHYIDFANNEPSNQPQPETATITEENTQIA